MRKRIILFALLIGISVMFWTPAKAKKELGNLPAQNNLTATLYPDSICFSWESVDGAVKYSLDVDVDVDGDSITDAEFSFGTTDRTDGGEPSDPNLCVPFTDFVFDLKGDGTIDQVFGTAYVKVKALNPGNGGRQNNAFLAEVDSSLIPPEPQCVDDPLFCAGMGW